MKLVWKCDFCSSTNVDKDVISRHEKDCTFNPVNKTCYTCDNRTPGDYPGDSDYCKIHDYGHFFDAEDGTIVCSDWINNELRIKKIKKIFEDDK